MSKLPKAVTKWLQEIGAKGGKATSPAKAAALPLPTSESQAKSN
jgi:hypothetical protein